MCLHIIGNAADSVGKPLSKKVETGWKIFEIYDKELYPWINWGHNPYKVGEWNADKREAKIISIVGSYISGYHIFKTRKAARERKSGSIKTSLSVIRKVEYSHVVAEGFESGEKVIVARRMRVLKDKV